MTNERPPAPQWSREIQAERDRQDAQWGGPEHDAYHDQQDWLAYIQKQWGRALDASVYSSVDALVDYRARLVKIAALAVAALQAFDLKEPGYGPLTLSAEPELEEGVNS